jgi:hypothetical protein
MKYQFTKFTHDISQLRRVNTTETTLIYADTIELAWEAFCAYEIDNAPGRTVSTEIVCQEKT